MTLGDWVRHDAAFRVSKSSALTLQFCLCELSKVIKFCISLHKTYWRFDTIECDKTVFYEVVEEDDGTDDGEAIEMDGVEIEDNGESPEEAAEFWGF